MIYTVKPFKEIGDLYGTKDSIVKPVVAIFFLVLIVSLMQRKHWIHALLGLYGRSYHARYPNLEPYL
jgi:hypothetical protein